MNSGSHARVPPCKSTSKDGVHQKAYHLLKSLQCMHSSVLHRILSFLPFSFLFLICPQTLPTSLYPSLPSSSLSLLSFIPYSSPPLIYSQTPLSFIPHSFLLCICPRTPPPFIPLSSPPSLSPLQLLVISHFFLSWASRILQHERPFN